MKKVLGLLAAAVIMFAGPVSAQEHGLPRAGLTPDSSFYFLDRFWESAQIFFTFDSRAKAELHVRFAAERVSEISVILNKEEPSTEALRAGFEMIEEHADELATLIGEIREREEAAALADSWLGQVGSLMDTLASIISVHQEALEKMAEEEEERVEQKLRTAAFADEVERELRRVAAVIDQEIGQPLGGFVVIEDESNVDVDGDTYSATSRAEADRLFGLAELQGRFLRNADTQGWESGDIDLTEDSLDITFEKTYPEVTIDGITLVPDASITISVTLNSPERGQTAINYDIDITLETASERLADLLEEETENLKEEVNEAADQLRESMEAQHSAEEAIDEEARGEEARRLEGRRENTDEKKSENNNGEE